MRDQDQTNVELFQSYFVGEERDFATWLEEYLHGGDAYPFLMGGRQQYDLGDLLRALLPPARKKEQDLLKISFQKRFAAACHSFDLEELRLLSHAVARSGFNSVTFDLANAVEIVLLKLLQANWNEHDKALAYVAIDQLVAALATFAFDGDTNAVRMSDILFRQYDLAPFASALFAPLAISDIKLWPILYSRLLDQASRPASLFGQMPEAKWRCDALGIQVAHFDLSHVFHDFLQSAIAKGHSLQDIYDATARSGLDPQFKARAEIALMEQQDRGGIIRRLLNDYDELYLIPTSVTPGAPRTLNPKRTALVDPSTERNWKPAIGQEPKQFSELLDTCASN